MSTQEQRDELRRKIEQSERRNEERSLADMARDAAAGLRCGPAGVGVSNSDLNDGVG